MSDENVKSLDKWVPLTTDQLSNLGWSDKPERTMDLWVHSREWRSKNQTCEGPWKFVETRGRFYFLVSTFTTPVIVEGENIGVRRDNTEVIER